MSEGSQKKQPPRKLRGSRVRGPGVRGSRASRRTGGEPPAGNPSKAHIPVSNPFNIKSLLAKVPPPPLPRSCFGPAQLTFAGIRDESIFGETVVDVAYPGSPRVAPSIEQNTRDSRVFHSKCLLQATARGICSFSLSLFFTLSAFNAQPRIRLTATCVQRSVSASHLPLSYELTIDLKLFSQIDTN